MIINLESVFNVEGLREELDYEIDMSGEEVDGAYPFKSPVKVKGVIANTTGIVEINAKAVYEFTIPCSRCAKEFTQTVTTEINHTLVQSVENEENDSLLVIDDLRFNVDPLIEEDIFLSLPYRYLCSENCKGLCSRCGKNLNEGPCSCKPEGDPRLDVLKQLLSE